MKLIEIFMVSLIVCTAYCRGKICYRENEEYRHSGVDCATCDNYKYVKCAPQYVPDCYCKPGYVRNNYRDCVHTSDCQITCGHNEVYSNSTACPTTCQNLGTAHICGVTVLGCHCIPGTVRDTTTGKCVPVQLCPRPKCGHNEEWTKCVSSCQSSCVHLEMRCHSQHCRPGCQCKSGYIRLSAHPNSPCVLREKCPRNCFMQCRSGEVSTCAMQECQPTCIEPDMTSCPSSSDKPGCECQKGLIRLMHGSHKCVRRADCTKELDRTCQMKDPNTFFNTGCGGNCIVSCIPRGCPKTCFPGCQCKPGYKADANNKCIPEHLCPRQRGYLSY